MSVVDLTGKPVDQPRPEVDQELVDRLEQVLVDARAGRLKSFAMATLTDDGGYSVAWAVGQGSNPATLAGAVSRLQWRLAEYMDDLAEGCTCR